MKANNLQQGRVYISSRGKKFKFVKLLERVTEQGFMIIEYIFKPIDQAKHVVVNGTTQQHLGDEEIIGCCRFDSVENFFKDFGELEDHKLALRKEKANKRFKR